ncbi:MAG: hypothetical protein AB1861_08650, partial [Cyanobacteriota bacterium]
NSYENPERSQLRLPNPSCRDALKEFNQIYYIPLGKLWIRKTKVPVFPKLFGNGSHSMRTRIA